MFAKLCLFLFLLTLEPISGRIRYKYRKRPECRDQVPRRVDELPSILVTGVIEQSYPPVSGSELYSSSVHVKSVLRGPKKIQESRVTVTGFGDPSLCYSSTSRGDSWILALQEVADGLYKLNGTLYKVNLNNLDRISALISDEPYRRRPEIVETPCELQYCANNGNCIEESSVVLPQARCQCLTSCPQSYEPVCGSNGETFSSDCQLRMDSCRREMNLFTRHLGTCEAGRRVRSPSIMDQFRLSLQQLSH